MTAIPCPHCNNAVHLLTSEQVADRLGLAPVTIRQRAVKRGIGIEVDARTRLYTPEDATALARHLQRGRPRKVQP